jgi:hypothetical protein
MSTAELDRVAKNARTVARQIAIAVRAAGGIITRRQLYHCYPSGCGPTNGEIEAGLQVLKQQGGFTITGPAWDASTVIRLTHAVPKDNALAKALVKLLAIVEAEIADDPVPLWSWPNAIAEAKEALSAE